MKRYHPHGDQSIYMTLVRMAQDWVMRHPLIHPQGNFGSIAGLPPAAHRYTEARLSTVAAEMLEDLVLGAVANALELAKKTQTDEMNKVAAGMNIPGLTM